MVEYKSVDLEFEVQIQIVAPMATRRVTLEYLDNFPDVYVMLYLQLRIIMPHT